MTTKPKLGRRHEPEPKSELFCETDISMLVARWNFLEADRRYRAALGGRELQPGDALHEAENDEIKLHSAVWVRAALATIRLRPPPPDRAAATTIRSA